MALRELWSSSPVSTTPYKIDIILVGGVDSPPRSNWSMSKGAWWISFLGELPAALRIFDFTYDHASAVPQTWASFLENGIALLDSLCTRSAASAEKSYLRILVGHGLGGVVLKQALCYANAQQQFQRHGPLLNSILGLMFLGVAHGSSDNALIAERSLLMIRNANVNMPKGSLLQLPEDTVLLSNVSKLFQDLQLTLPMLNIFEKDATSMKPNSAKLKGIFAPKKKLVLVDETIAKIGLPNEVMLGLNSSHYELCHVDSKDDLVMSELGRWIKFVFSSTHLSTIERQLSIVRTSVSPTISMTSMSSFDALRRAIEDNPVPSDIIRNPLAHHDSIDVTVGSSEMKDWDVVPGIEDKDIIRQSVRLPCFMMETPERNLDFCKREQVLEALDKALLPTKTATVLSEGSSEKHVVLCGFGGVGKTSIAIEFAFSRKAHFDAIFWIRADDPAKLEYDFSQIASYLGLEEPVDGRNPVVSRNLARGWLEKPEKVLDAGAGLMSQVDAHWLIIFDNADEPDVLQDYCPGSGNGSILITSRDPRSKVSPRIASKTIDITPLDVEDAADMLRQLSRVTGDIETSIQIARGLGGLPLAISQMAAVIQHHYMSLVEFLEMYEDIETRQQLQSLQAVAPRPEARGNIVSIWLVEQVSLESMPLLELFSILDPDCIQDILILKHLTVLGQYIDGFPDSRVTYNKARAELVRRALISRNEQRQEFLIHRVLQDIVRTRMTRERLIVIFNAALKAVSAAWGITDLVQRHTISLAENRHGLFPHVISLKNIYQIYQLGKDREISLLLGSQMNEAGWYQHERGNSHEIKPFLFLALNICAQFPGPEAVELSSDAHYCLAACANETNDIDGCYTHTSELLRLRQDVSRSTGVQDLRLAIAHNEFAIALACLSRYDDAIQEQLKSIKVYEQLPDFWPGMDTNPRTNMGFVLWNIGRHTEALATFTRLLADREAKFGVMDNESFRTGRVLYGIGNVLESQGDYISSEEWHRKAVTQWTSTIGKKHHKTADGCLKVALHCIRRRDLPSANTLLIQALSIYNLHPTIYKPQIARTLYYKSKLTMMSGAPEEAAELFRTARDLRATIPWAEKRARNNLHDRDFDQLVVFWSR